MRPAHLASQLTKPGTITYTTIRPYYKHSITAIIQTYKYKPSLIFNFTATGYISHRLAAKKRFTAPIAAAASSPRNDMTLHQRLRAIQFAIKDKRQAIAQSPPIVAVLAAIAAVRAKLQPLYDLIAALQAKLDVLNEDYNQFIAQETKRKWTWSKRFAKELTFWQSVPPYLYCK